jgi:carbonic anhydrase
MRGRPRRTVLAFCLAIAVVGPTAGLWRSEEHSPYCSCGAHHGMGQLTAAERFDAPSSSPARRLPAEAKAALDQLIEGNNRFAAGKPKHVHTSKEWREELANDQKPFATILGCSDSRVPPELIFDRGFGDLFIVRVAGNCVDPEVTGSLEYAGRHLGTRLFVVLGHERCGAVTAVVAADAEMEKEPPGLTMLLQRIRPSLKSVDRKLSKEKQIAAAIEANVRWSMKQLREAPEHQKAFEANLIGLVGAVYELKTGKVRFLE